MPSTPFHVAPSTIVGWPLRRHLDLPSFLLANLTIDLEPGIVRLLELDPLPHGPAHTLLGATVVGAATGWLLWRGKGLVERALRDEYPLRRGVAMASGAAGCWLHVLLDSVMYTYLRPFYPLAANPLHIAGSGDILHLIGALALVPALALMLRARYWRTIPEKLTLGLLTLSAVAMGIYAALGIVELASYTALGTCGVPRVA